MSTRLPVLQEGHVVTLLEGGRAYFPALEQAIDASRDEVRMETYMFCFDQAGQAIAEALVRAAGRGVQVHLVVDGAGTPTLPAHWESRFQEAGVLWHVYSPMGPVGWLLPSRWRRLHRKLCVIDRCTAFCGGINVLDDFEDPHHGHLRAPRVDFAVQVRGPLVGAAHEVIRQFWWRLQARSSASEGQLPSAWAALRASARSADAAGKRPLAVAENGKAVHVTDSTVRAALLLRDNLRHRSHIERAYRKAIGEARRDVLIANAYFLPGVRLRAALLHAARRGVRVRVMLQGRYEYFMQYHAARPAYLALLEAGVEIIEYDQSFLHAKVAVIDGHWATVGSSNLDPLSLLLAREANVVVDDTAFAADLQSRLEQAMAAGGKRIQAREFALRGWWSRGISWSAYGLMRALLWVTGKRY